MSEIKYMLVIHDNKNHWKITDVYTTDDPSFTLDPKLYYQCTEELYNFVVEKMKYNRLTIKKDLVGYLGAHITQYDIVLEQIDPLNVIKHRAFETASNSIQGRCTILHQLEIFNFVVANNKLLEKGFIITDENKDKKFLEIVATEDDELIADLENYLYAKDYISIAYTWYNEFKNFQKDLEISDNESEVNDALQKLLDKIE